MHQFSAPPADVVGTIASLWVFPIKSCAGIAVPQARLLASGLEWDRAWMLVDAAGNFLTQRDQPRMALIRPSIDPAAGLLRVVSPDCAQPLELPLELPWMASAAQFKVRVWRSEVLAWDLGDQAAAWFSAAVGQPCRLVRYDPSQPRYSNTKWTGGIRAPNQFADGYPLLVTTASAVADLNARLAAQGHAPVDGLRFRANIVLQGLEPHEEDYLETLWLEEAEPPVALRMAKPCSRCPIPDIDPATATSSPEVGLALQAYRRDGRLDGAITFGMHAVVAQGVGALLRVGQSVGGQLQFA